MRISSSFEASSNHTTQTIFGKQSGSESATNYQRRAKGDMVINMQKSTYHCSEVGQGTIRCTHLVRQTIWKRNRISGRGRAGRVESSFRAAVHFAVAAVPGTADDVAAAVVVAVAIMPSHAGPGDERRVVTWHGKVNGSHIACCDATRFADNSLTLFSTRTHHTCVLYSILSASLPLGDELFWRKNFGQSSRHWR